MRWIFWLGITSLLPIWRVSTRPNEGLNLWQMIQEIGISRVPHVLTDTAVREARAAQSLLDAQSEWKLV